MQKHTVVLLPVCPECNKVTFPLMPSLHIFNGEKVEMHVSCIEKDMRRQKRKSKKSLPA